jgi:hypothetical protein
MAEARQIIQSYLDPLTGLIQDSQRAAWLEGAGRAAVNTGGPALTAALGVPPPFSLLPQPPEPEPAWDGMDSWLPLIRAAVDDLKSRKLLRKEAYDQESDQAKANAFTVAGQKTEEAVGKVRDALVEAVDKGQALPEFTETVKAALLTSPIGPGQMENVFRTNIASAYSRGMDQVLDHPVVAEQFPYEETLPIRDSRLTDLCWMISRSGLDGTAIFRRDDPTWKKFKPPRHWRCRCGRRALTVEQAAAKGVKEAQAWLRMGTPPGIPEWVTPPAVELPEGWVS